MNKFSDKKALRMAGKAMLGLTIAAILTGCGEAEFKIKGEIDGADNQALLLEKSDFHGRWVIVDSTRTSSDGSFSISRPAPAAPEIFRLALDDRYIYLPIDSVETVTVNSSLKDYGREYTLSGTPKAEAMARFEKDVMALPDNISADSLNSFKRKVYTEYMGNAQGSIVSYYILTKLIGNKPLFDPNSDTDYRYFAAVATGFHELRPNDPRTRLLEQTSMDAIRRRNTAKGNRVEIQATEISVIDIDLPDEEGKNRKLSDYTGKGKPVVVMFTALTHPDAPAANAELSKIYNSRPMEVYQVSLDPDQYAWRDAARNLPWITVYDNAGQYSDAAVKYNVSTMPVYFLYDSAGELRARANTTEELRKELSKL